MILLWLACQTPVWTEAAALAPHRARLDQDQDGKVSAAEYEKTLWNGPPFGSADRDGDGDLSVAEVVLLVKGQSPSSFDGPGGGESVKKGGAGVEIPPDSERDLIELFAWMEGALQAAGQPALDPAQVQAAVHSGRVDSPESLRVWAMVKPRWEAQGWTWPAGLP